MPATTSYDPEYFAPLFAAEERHFWFRARNALIGALARKALAGRSASRLLEIGCGTGNVLRALRSSAPGGTLVGMDLFIEGLHIARRRVDAPLVQADVSRAPFDAGFDLIGLFDVIEHLPEDEQVLRDAAALLAPGGTLLVTVPAFPSLWSYFDEAAHHVRRYRRAELGKKLAAAGLQVTTLSYSMLSIFPLVWLQRRLMRAHGTSDHDRAVDELRIVPVINEILAGLLTLEARLCAAGVRLPFGTSLIAVARRP